MPKNRGIGFFLNAIQSYDGIVNSHVIVVATDVELIAVTSGIYSVLYVHLFI